ncbi:TPA: hypothetical protein N0F65_001052 [Lagenidium giganteum]|uniref:Peptidase S59 domain-containing protein n=1 Tax=Lagenidium giganteum TaxID=4803 RepID=A0AAV2YPU3_9STRA|nr:TPA: hypothetical protein N0F65_001052 [Lagenidium giganteum]
MTDAELARVEGFRVECTGRGSIEWIGETDVRGLNLDAIVDFGDDAFAVYTNIPENRKPVVGHGLNKPAVVQLENLFPCDGQGTNDFFTLLRDRAVAGGAHVLDYSRTTGVFRFRVEHF